MGPRAKGSESDARGPTERRFFLVEGPIGSGPWKPALMPEDAEHARVVLRMEAGDRCIGLDGMGSAWPLVVTTADRRRFEVELAGERRTEPAPGEEGASLPWIEVAVAMPRGSRAEEMLDALVQLGVAAVTPLVTRRSPPAARSEGESRRQRLLRITREACKQSGRLWNVRLDVPIDVDGLSRRGSVDILRLDPRADGGLSDRLEKLGGARWTREHPLLIAVGPEGGFEPEEERALDAAGASAVSLSPHILRIETAAVAALAVVVERLQRR